MKRLNTIKYVAETSIEDILKKVKDDKLSVENVIIASLESRKEYGLKIQELINRLEELR